MFVSHVLLHCPNNKRGWNDPTEEEEEEVEGSKPLCALPFVNRPAVVNSCQGVSSYPPRLYGVISKIEQLSARAGHFR